MQMEQIENYKIIEKTGEGGMAEVFQAQDINHKKTVAIKTIKDNVNVKDESYLRFKQEAKLLAGLSHPGILKFIDIIEKEHKVFIVTEFLSGRNLKICIQEKLPELSIDNKIDIIKQIAEALDYVHSQGIIHKDIKPSNIMLLENNRIKVLDFGVANLTSYQDLFSRHTSLAGSFLYMSPEQSGILKRSIDHRTDIYSLGILFYELICGKPPYYADEIGELLHQHIAKTPDEPSAIIPDLPPIINKIILKLIKKDPDERYQTAYGLAEDLKSFQQLSPKERQTLNFELGKKDKIKNLNYRTRLIGRKEELKQLIAPINETAFGKGFVTLVTGKQGTGKTRLISEIQKYSASKNALYVSAINSEADLNNPYYPFAESMRNILQHIQTKLPEKRQQEIYESLTKGLGNDGKILSTIIQELIPIIGKYDTNIKMDNDDSNLFFEKLKDFFILMASPSNPLILSFDNVNFWDQGSIQFFLYFIEYISKESIYIVLSISEEEIIKNRLIYETILAKTKAGKAGIVNLSPFNLDETKDLIVEIFGTVYSGIDIFSAELFDATQGNALLIIENIKTTVEEEIIYQENEGWNINADKLKNFHFSGNIVDKIIKRLSKLDKNLMEILNYAAIIRNNFSLNLLYHFMIKNKYDGKKEALIALLNNAVKSQMLTEVLSHKGEISYNFNNEKIIEILLSHLTEKQLKALHKSCAEIIEKEYKKDDKIFRLAYHYLEADSRNNAYNYNIEAAKKALSNYSIKQAGKFYYNALNIIRNYGADNEKALISRIILTLEIVDLNLQLGDHEENIHLLEEIRPLAEKINHQNHIAKILFLLGRNFSFIGNNHLAMEYYQKALPIAQKLYLKDILAVIYSSIGRAHVYSAEYSQAIDYIKKGIQMFPPEDSLEKLYPLGMLGQSYCYLGYKKEAMAIINELSSYKYANNEMMKVWSSFYIAVIQSYVGEPLKAIEECEKVHEMAREDKITVLELNSLLILARAQFFAGYYKDAIKNLLRYINLSIQHHLVFLVYLGYLFLAECYAITGNINAAKNSLTEAIEKYTTNLNEDFIKQWACRLTALFEVFSHTPDYHLAMESIDEAIKRSQIFGDAGKYMLSQNFAVKFYILFKMENENEAEQYFEKAITFFKEKDLQNDINLIRKIRTKLQSKKEMSEINIRTFDETQTSATITDSITTTAFSYQRQLKYLIKLSEQLSALHEMDGLLLKIMELAMEASGAERGCLFLINDGKCEMKIKSVIGNNDSTETFLFSESTLSKTIETQKGQLILDAENELPDDISVVDFQLKSIITVPLTTQGKMLGVVYLDNKHVKGLFNEENFELLKAFAIEAAISIENAKLYLQVKEIAKTEQELAIAKDIQVSILPEEIEVNGYQIATFMRTAAEVGGDYYDFYLKEEPYFGVFGDVSGHGLKSGLIMMMAEVSFNALVRAENFKNQSLPAIYQTINSTLYENIQNRLSQKSFIASQYSNMYMTFRLFRFDKEGNFEMFGNDHAEPFIVENKTGKITPIKSSGFIIGILSDAIKDNDKSYSFRLAKDDLLVLYSDGITEAKVKKSERTAEDKETPLFGDERLYQIVEKNRNLTPEEIIKKVITSVDDWMDEQYDDISIAVIKKI